MTTLWDVLGQPEPSAHVPLWRTAAAADPRNRLLAAARQASLRCSFRSWTQVWHLCHTSALPLYLTWGHMCGQLSWDQFVQEARQRQRQCIARFQCWNLRWMVDPLTDANSSKRAIILRHALQGSVLALQETHWDEISIAIWERLLPGCSLLASPAQVGQENGRCGGVAIVFPPHVTIAAQRELVPGYALYGLGQPTGIHPDTTADGCLSFYLPPGEQMSTLRRLRHSLETIP